MNRSVQSVVVGSWQYFKNWLEWFIDFLHEGSLLYGWESLPSVFQKKILFLRFRHYGPKLAQNDQKWAQQQGYYHITRKLDDIWRNSEFWVRLPVLGPKILHFQNIGMWPLVGIACSPILRKKNATWCCEKWEIKN